MSRNLLAFILLAFAHGAIAQQVPDREFRPPLPQPAHAPGKGPVVCVDEAHHNFHTLGDRFFAFGELLRRDGYVLRANTQPLDQVALAACAILVISNALPSDADWLDYPSPTPSAFTPEEIAATRRWVEGGGKLLLIADHMPLAGAAKALAAAFEVEFTDGFAMAGHDDEPGRNDAMAKPTIFRREDGTLVDHAIVRGRGADEAVASLRSFTGQAFKAPANASPVMVLPADFVSLHPAKTWGFGPNTPKVAVGGWLQGATMEVGQGRVAFFGEAAMFTAQLVSRDRRPMGMNAPGAERNPQFVLNVLHWLSGSLPPRARQPARSETMAHPTERTSE